MSQCRRPRCYTLFTPLLVKSRRKPDGPPAAASSSVPGSRSCWLHTLLSCAWAQACGGEAGSRQGCQTRAQYRAAYSCAAWQLHTQTESVMIQARVGPLLAS